MYLRVLALSKCNTGDLQMHGSILPSDAWQVNFS